MNLTDLTPDIVLAEWLDGKVEVQTSDNEKIQARAYAQAQMPNKGLDSEFLTIQNNGVISSWTKPIGQFKGNLALTLYSEAHSDGTAKTNRLRRMLAQCVGLINNKSLSGFFFEIDATNVITPPTTNLTTGYATTVINVAWHTT